MKLQLYIVYINDIVKSYILPLINHEPFFICILLFVVGSDDSCDLKTSSSKWLNVGCEAQFFLYDFQILIKNNVLSHINKTLGRVLTEYENIYG